MGIAAAVLAGAKAVEAVFVFLATPEGQATVRQWRENTDKVNNSLERAGNWVEGLLKG